jgi:hypothetical protein
MVIPEIVGKGCSCNLSVTLLAFVWKPLSGYMSDAMTVCGMSVNDNLERKGNGRGLL